MNDGRKPVIFCDFDGTITKSDNIVAIMKHFHPPGWGQLVEGVIQRTLTIREGVGRMFQLLPSSEKERILKFVRDTAQIREGFGELLAWCSERELEFFVTSGGIDFFVYPLLEPYPIERDHIYCNAGNFSGDRIVIEWPHKCDEHCDNDCGMCKTKVIRQFPKDAYFRILIGDSITDFEGAKLADLVFARSHLLERGRELGLPYVPYETFYDIVQHLKQGVCS